MVYMFIARTPQRPLEVPALTHGRNNVSDRTKDAPSAIASAPPAEATGNSVVSPKIESRQSSEQGEFLLLDQLKKKFPEFDAASNRNLRRAIRNWYGDLGQRLDIDKATDEAITSILVEKNQTQQDFQDVLIAQGIKTSDPQFRKTIIDSDAQFDAQIRGILGIKKFELFQKLPLIIDRESELAAQYAPEFKAAGAPLNSEQISALAQIMITKKTDVVVNTPNPENGFLSTDDLLLLQNASNTLTGDQLNILKNRLVDKNTQKYYYSTYHKSGSRPKK